jgi:hypothetical protein
MAAYVMQHQQSLWQQRQALIAKESQSKVRASYGVHPAQHAAPVPIYQQKEVLPGCRSQPLIIVACAHN